MNVSTVLSPSRIRPGDSTKRQSTTRRCGVWTEELAYLRVVERARRISAFFKAHDGTPTPCPRRVAAQTRGVERSRRLERRSPMGRTEVAQYYAPRPAGRKKRQSRRKTLACVVAETDVMREPYELRTFATVNEGD